MTKTTMFDDLLRSFQSSLNSLKNDLEKCLDQAQNELDSKMIIAQRASCPQIKDVLHNDVSTRVNFTDGSFSEIIHSEDSKCNLNNLEAAILKAIVKRTFATSVDSTTGETRAEHLESDLNKIISERSTITHGSRSFEASKKNDKREDTKKSRISEILSSEKCCTGAPCHKSILRTSTLKKPTSRPRDSRGRFIKVS